MSIDGGAGDDNLRGTTGNDTFDLHLGGNDIARGLAGQDTFDFGATFDGGDFVDGGAGSDILRLNGDYSAGVTLNAGNVARIEQVTMLDGFDYKLVVQNGAIDAGKLVNVDAFSLGVGHHLTLNGSAELDSNFFVSGGADSDDIRTGAGNDQIFPGTGDDIVRPGLGHDEIDLGDGEDRVIFSGNGALDPADRVSGSDDLVTDTLELSGDYSGGLVLAKATITFISEVVFDAGHDYVLDVNHIDPTQNAPYIYDGSALHASDTLHIDGHNVGHEWGLSFYGGAGADVFSGADGYNSYVGGGGADRMTANLDADVFYYDAVSESAGRHYDTIVGFNTHHDFFDPHVGGIHEAPSGVNEKVTDGTLTTAHFNADLEQFIGTNQLDEDAVVLFKAQHGNLANEWFLIMDGNGIAGYQANADVVVHLKDPVNIGDFGEGNFGTAG